VTVTRAERAYYLAQQRVMRDVTNTAQVAWSGMDETDPRGSWAEARPTIVDAVAQAQTDGALPPRYIAGMLAAAGAASRPLGELVAAAFAHRAANGLSLASLMDFAFSSYPRALALHAPPDGERVQVRLVVGFHGGQPGVEVLALSLDHHGGEGLDVLGEAVQV
jgi:hypothetical protein